MYTSLVARSSYTFERVVAPLHAAAPAPVSGDAHERLPAGPRRGAAGRRRPAGVTGDGGAPAARTLEEVGAVPRIRLGTRGAASKKEEEAHVCYY